MKLVKSDIFSFFDFDDDNITDAVEDEIAEDTTSYADKVNSRFYKSESHYVTIPELLEHYTFLPAAKDLVNNTKRFFYNKYKSKYQSWDDIKLCESIPVPLSKILIDITLQRVLDVNHLCKIVNEFDENAALAIKVYRSDLRPDYYTCYDGMHTVTALFLIANALGLETNLDECIVPVNISHSKQKPVIRHNLVYLNTTAAKRFDLIDLYHQYLFGTRTDGSEYPEWLVAEQKQQLLESAGMFATHFKFGDSTKPGAFPVMSEFLNTKYSIDITKHFCEYFKAVCNVSRAVETKESWLLYDFFKACELAEIDVSQPGYIQAVADALNTACNGEFNAIKFYNYATTAYDNWYRNQSMFNNLKGIQRKEKSIGSVYLHAVLSKHTTLTLPFPKGLWYPDASDVK